MRANFEVAQALDQHWAEVENHPRINRWQLRTLSALKRCRTSDLGGHVDACTECGTVRISYNSNRNRHCPKCQGKNREKWLADREAELLPVPYFHVVFTLPDTLNKLAMHQPKPFMKVCLKLHGRRSIALPKIRSIWEPKPG